MKDQNSLYYVGYYAPYSDDRERHVAMSSISKMDYISKAIKQLGIPITIYSPIYSKCKKLRYYPRNRWVNKNGIEVWDAATISACNPIIKLLSQFLMEFQLFCFLVARKKNDKVLLYHAMGMRLAVSLARFFRHFDCIMEVEELYSAAWGKEEFSKEIHYLSKADKYVYVNDVMPKRFGFTQPFAVCYGNYEFFDKSVSYTGEEEKTLIYAGVIGGKGTDVYVAIDTLKFLPSEYKLKIAGYSGVDDDIVQLKKTIEGDNRISFWGQLSGKEYDAFLFSGRYGLCTRVLEDHLSDYTFPSKVMVYLGHGLIPVCPRLNCLYDSKVRDYLLFVDSLNAEVIAESILKNQDQQVGNASFISSLDENFKKEMALILGNDN